MSWENKTIYKFTFPVYFSPSTKYFTKSSTKVYAYQITRHSRLFFVLFPALWPRGRNTYYAVVLRAKALLEAEILHHQLWKLMCTAGLHMIFPEQHKCSEKSLPIGFGGKLVFTRDLILLNILHMRFFLFILDKERDGKLILISPTSECALPQGWAKSFLQEHRKELFTLLKSKSALLSWTLHILNQCLNKSFVASQKGIQTQDRKIEDAIKKTCQPQFIQFVTNRVLRKMSGSYKFPSSSYW